MPDRVPYELWNQETANLIDAFEDLDDARAFFREVLAEQGAGVMAEWSFGSLDDTAFGVKAGTELLEWVTQEEAQHGQP